MLGAKIKLTSPYYPQGNSVIERSHRTLSNMLRTMLLEKEGRDWSSLLPSVMLYMNSMIQEKTGVSACEILFGNNPSLPSDISYTPVTSLSDDKEGYVKQLKRDLKDIRQKLSRVLGQDLDQSDNPFAVGDKVIIAILPHENANKLMAKWKRPFTVTKIPNRFQIEYLDGSVMRLTHISYAKKYHERYHYTEQVGVPRQKRVNHRKPRVRMAHIRLVAGSGRRRPRMIFYSMKAIQDKWPVHSGRIRVRILGEEKDLPTDLQAIVEATGPDKCIEGNVLVDLCMQRFGRRESGCDAPKASEGFPKASEGFPTPVASPPRTPTPPAAQVKQYSWRNYAKKEVCLYIRTLKPLKTKKEEGKLKFKRPGATNCQNHSDVIVSDVIVSDVIVNKPVARKRYAQKKHSLVSKKGFLKNSLSMYSQTFTKVALMLVIVISILGGVFNVKLPERISTIETPSSSSRSSELAKPRTTIRCHGYSTLSEPTLTRNVLAGKHLDTYIFPSADFWASRVYYLETYTANLESDDNFTEFYDLIYIYIYILFTVHGHPVTGQYTQGLFYILWFIFP